jgi:hypothetical protein
MRVRIALVAALSFVPGIAFGACGGPGYRGPDGRCVGWAALARVCGSPPSQKCTAERPQAKANEAAEHGSEMRRFMENARERAMGY